jgi:hypothetical protein
LIELGTLAILRGSLRPRERADVMAWARGNPMESTQPTSNRHFTLTGVQAEADAGLQLVYADGAVLRVGLKALVDGHPLLSALRDPLVFGTARHGTARHGAGR